MPQSLWDAYYASHKDDAYDETRVPYKGLFDRYLKPGGSCLEIGFLPGDILTYLSGRFRFVANGIDLTPFNESEVRARMVRNGGTVGRLVNADFLSFAPEESFDVVCSFGFIEHFSDPEDIITKHVEFLRPGGTLVISCPNFTGAQYFMHYWLDRENLQNHNLKAMDLGLWRRVLRANGMRILFQGYYGTFGFWTADSPTDSWLKRGVAASISRIARAADSMSHHPNALFSPSMVSFSSRES
jgi:SAM-dependent methyltransferase